MVASAPEREGMEWAARVPVAAVGMALESTAMTTVAWATEVLPWVAAGRAEAREAAEVLLA